MSPMGKRYLEWLCITADGRVTGFPFYIMGDYLFWRWWGYVQHLSCLPEHV